MNQNLQPKVRLNNGLLMPQIGLGVWKTPLETTRQMVCDALANDYVLLDTAKQYGNESAVGQGMQDAFQSTGRTRASVFLTTKIYNGDQGDYDRVRKGFEGQLQALQTDYVDLLLMHWPVNDLYNQTWQAMERIYADGQAKAIGVCNFDVERMRDLLDHAQITPAINQIEFNPKIHPSSISASSMISKWKPGRHWGMVRSFTNRLSKRLRKVIKKRQLKLNCAGLCSMI